MRIPALRLGGLQRGDRALRARAGLADASARRATATRPGPRPTSGRTCTATISCMPGRCSSTSSRTPGSTFAASGIASCARSAATISRTAGARRYVQREYAQRNPREFAGYDEDCWGLTAVRRPERSRLPGTTGAGGDCSATRRAACPTARTTARSPAGRRSRRCRSRPRSRCAAARSMHRRYPGDAGRTALREQLQSEARRRRRRAWVSAGPLRPRPGHRGDDDREPSHRADLAADAELSLHASPACGAPDSAAAGCSRRR